MLIHSQLNASKNWYLTFLALNVILSILVMLVLAGNYTSNASTYFNKARMTEALMEVTVLKNQLMTDYFYSGFWPRAGTLKTNDENQGGIIRQIDFDGNGTINVFFNDFNTEFSHKTLSFTAAHIPQSGFSSLLWICGYASLPEKFKTMGYNKTSIEPLYLPRSCK